MFTGFTDKTIDFMWGIRMNNEKPWFEEHKADYKTQLEAPMKELGSEAFDAVSEKCGDLDIILKVSRIYRDMRRNHGKGPYKDHLWFCVRQPAEEWIDKPVFWFELMPEIWSYGLGYYCAKAQTMAKFRARIDNDPKPMEKLVKQFNKQSEFVLEGESYSKPKGDPGELLYDWYNMKNFSLIHEQPNGEEIFSADLSKRIAEGFLSLLPFYIYLNSIESDGI